MSDSPQYEAFREFARATIALEVLKATQPMQEEVRSLRTQLQTRTVTEPIASQAGRDGKDGIDGKDGRDGKDGAVGEAGARGADGIAGANGKDGRDGVDGKAGAQGEKGERGADGIATREEIMAIVEERAADINVRTFADVYQGVYEPNKLYARGVLATWGGSLWLALAETQAKPGESPNWKLVVKKGADGRK